MSTKIFDAYRTKLGVDLWQLIAKIRPQAEKNVTRLVQRVYCQLEPGVDTNSPDYAKQLKIYGNEFVARAAGVRDFILKAYKQQLGSGLRNSFNYDVCVAIRKLGRRYYLRCHFDYPLDGVLDFLKELPELEEYEYRNSSDAQLEDMSVRAWRARGRTWDRVEKNWHNFLILPICDYDSYFQDLDPWHDRDPLLAQLKGMKNAPQ